MENSSLENSASKTPSKKLFDENDDPFDPDWEEEE